MGRIYVGALLIGVCLAPHPAGAVTIDWSTVGNTGNAADAPTGHGKVNYSYQISTYKITNSQYVEFLNAKDPNGVNSLALFNANMQTSPYGGIAYASANPSGAKYSPIAGAELHPVNYVNFFDALRFANWLNNGQGNGDTESGAYALVQLAGSAQPSNGLTVQRNADAKVFLPTLNEWYKAAYFNPATNSYFLYATSSNTSPTASLPTATPNSANFQGILQNLTDVGSYTGTTSPYGLYDTVGNVFEWTETRGGTSGADRFVGSSEFNYAAAIVSIGIPATDPIFQLSGTGIRVARIPEPTTAILAVLACGSLYCGRIFRRSAARQNGLLINAAD